MLTRQGFKRRREKKRGRTTIAGPRAEMPALAGRLVGSEGGSEECAKSDHGQPAAT